LIFSAQKGYSNIITGLSSVVELST